MSTFRFLCFGSGSSGNCFYYQTDQGAFLIDAGVSIRRLIKYMNEYAIHMPNIKAIFLTHDHVDHVRCAYVLANKYEIPVYATQGTWEGIEKNPTIRKKGNTAIRHIVEKQQPLECCGCTLEAFTVPHDSQDNVGYLISYGDVKVAHVTDVGHVTDDILSYIAKANRLVLEANYDADMLRKGPYPFFLKKRIAGELGHLSNKEAAEIIAEHYQHLTHVWLCHLSENNNHPQNALNAVDNALKLSGVGEKDAPEVVALKRTSPSGFFNL